MMINLCSTLRNLHQAALSDTDSECDEITKFKLRSQIALVQRTRHASSSSDEHSSTDRMFVPRSRDKCRSSSCDSRQYPGKPEYIRCRCCGKLKKPKVSFSDDVAEDTDSSSDSKNLHAAASSNSSRLQPEPVLGWLVEQNKESGVVCSHRLELKSSKETSSVNGHHDGSLQIERGRPPARLPGRPPPGPRPQTRGREADVRQSRATTKHPRNSGHSSWDARAVTVPSQRSRSSTRENPKHYLDQSGYRADSSGQNHRTDSRKPGADDNQSRSKWQLNHPDLGPVQCLDNYPEVRTSTPVELIPSYIPEGNNVFQSQPGPRIERRSSSLDTRRSRSAISSDQGNFSVSQIGHLERSSSKRFTAKEFRTFRPRSKSPQNRSIEGNKNSVSVQEASDVEKRRAIITSGNSGELRVSSRRPNIENGRTHSSDCRGVVCSDRRGNYSAAGSSIALPPRTRRDPMPMHLQRNNQVTRSVCCRRVGNVSPQGFQSRRSHEKSTSSGNEVFAVDAHPPPLPPRGRPPRPNKPPPRPPKPWAKTERETKHDCNRPPPLPPRTRRCHSVDSFLRQRETTPKLDDQRRTASEGDNEKVIVEILV